MIYPVIVYPTSPPPSSLIEQLRALALSGQRPSMSLAEFLALPDLEAELRVPERLDPALASAPIVSAHISDVADPRPFLAGSELILTTGIGFTDDDEWYLRYASWLRDAGTVAIGFGIEPVFSDVPEGLVRACREVGLPLVAFAPRIPFAHITMAFFAAIENQRIERLDRLNRLALALMRAALAHDPATAVVHALAVSLDALVVFERGDERITDGRIGGAGVRLAAGAVGAVDAESVGAESVAEDRGLGDDVDAGTDVDVDVDGILAALPEAPPASEPSAGATTGSDGRGARASRLARAHLPEFGVDVVTVRLRAERGRLPLRSRLVVVAPRRLESTDLTAALLAADTLQLARAGIVPDSASVDTLLLGLVLDALARGDRPQRERTMRLLRSALGVRPRAALFACAARRRDDSAAPADARAWWRTELATPFVDRRDNVLRALVATPPSEATLAAMRAEGWDVATIGPLDAGAIPDGLADAVALAGRGSRRPAGTAGAGTAWAGFASAEVRRAAARRLLEPLNALSAAERAELETVLRTWLEQHGGWDGTARETGLHRNAVRRLVAQAERLLGVQLADARARAELLFALDELR